MRGDNQVSNLCLRLIRLKRKLSEVIRWKLSHLLLHLVNGITTQSQKPGRHFDSSLYLIPTPNQVTKSFRFYLVSISSIQLLLSVTTVHTLVEAAVVSHLDYYVRL